ncbi:MAG: hypothetical protein U9Q81_14895 [Pseudomonadota bacterium]|nr:hypothetical protein [Pseudomonadota bacterium]
MKALYIAWQDPPTRRWHTVGRLDRDEDGRYRFGYTGGALASPRFTYLGRMMDKTQFYYSDALFPLFANRLLAQKRPEYPAYLSWMGVEETKPDPLEVLARSGGRRGTDQLCVYPEIEPDAEGRMTLYFFAHGLRYLSPAEYAGISRLRSGDGLQLRPDDDNTHDRYALLLETGHAARVGYCPRYLNRDLRRVQHQAPVRLVVEKVNHDAPLQFQLLCKVVFTPPDGFHLYATDEHRLIAQPAMAA